jgi:hypothetical protein
MATANLHYHIGRYASANNGQVVSPDGFGDGA